MKYRFVIHMAAFLILATIVVGVPQFVVAPMPMRNEEQSGSPKFLALDTRPTPTAIPSRFGPSVPTVPPSMPQYRETIDLAPNLPKEEKALMIFRKNSGEYVNYLVEPNQVREQILKVSEELGPESFQTVHYSSELYPWLIEDKGPLPEDMPPPPIDTADPAFVHPEVPVPPTPLPQSGETFPTPTATPSEFGPSVPTADPGIPQYRETIDLAPDSPDKEKAELIFRNDSGTYIHYLVAEDEVRDQVLRLSEKLGPESLELILYPFERFPELREQANLSPLIVATPDPAFVHPEVPVPPTPLPTRTPSNE